MTKEIQINHLFYSACETFGQIDDLDELWNKLHHFMQPYGVTNMVFGTAMACAENTEENTKILNSLKSGWFEEKIEKSLFFKDECLHNARINKEPTLWKNSINISDGSDKARLSIEIDHDFGVTTGVTLPMFFSNGLGESGLGCQAANMSVEEFDRIWLENSQIIQSVAHAFDVQLRRDHIGALFPLSQRERECLLWLAAGLRPKQVAYRLGTHPKTVDKQITSARKKLKAINNSQAVATALVFGIITP